MVMRARLLTLLRVGALSAVVATALAGPARAQTQPAIGSDSAAVLAVVQRLFDAMAQRDTVAARALLMPGSRFVSLRTSGPTAVPRQQTDTAFLRSLATGREKLHERMWNPIVRVHGQLAEVWTPYDFHIDGRFSHCGVDSFTLMKIANVWQLVTIVYTVEPTGCAPSPLGPPK